MKLVPVSCKHPLSLLICHTSYFKTTVSNSLSYSSQPQIEREDAGDLRNTTTVNTGDRKTLYKQSWFRNGDSLPRKGNYENIQKLKVKYLEEILCSNLEVTGDMKADLELKF